MSLFEWAGLVILCLAGAASPGPSLAVVIHAGAAGGRAAGLATAWSHALGVGLYALLTVAGVSAIIAVDAATFTLLQAAGAVYLLWLAYGLWSSASSDDSGATAERALHRSVRDGFVVAFLNPKLAIFMLALFSQFVQPGAAVATKIGLVATATLVDGLWYSFVTLVLTRESWLARLRANAALIDRVFAVLLASLAALILWRAVSGGA